MSMRSHVEVGSGLTRPTTSRISLFNILYLSIWSLDNMKHSLKATNSGCQLILSMCPPSHVCILELNLQCSDKKEVGTALFEAHWKCQLNIWSNSQDRMSSTIPEGRGRGRRLSFCTSPCSYPAVCIYLDNQSNCPSPKQNIHLRRCRRHHQLHELCSCSHHLPAEQMSQEAACGT